MVFGTISPQFLAEMDRCVHCTVHNTNRHMLNSFAQPGSQLIKSVIQNYIHRYQKFRETRNSKKKEGFGVSLAHFQQVFLLDHKAVGPGQLRLISITPLSSYREGVLHQLQIRSCC